MTEPTSEPVVVESYSLGDKEGRFQYMPLKERAVCFYGSFIDLLEFKGGMKAFADFHREMIEFLTKPQRETIAYFAGSPVMNCLLAEHNRRRLLLVPRGHLKSTLCSVGYVLWRMYRNPNIRICVATATKDLALQFVREVKQYLEDANLQESVWNQRPHIKGRMIPILDKAGAKRRDQKRMQNEDISFTEAEDKKIVWRSDAIQVMRSQIMKEPTLIAASPGSNITGMHFDLVIMDDIINDDTTATADKINKTLDWAMDLESVIDDARVVYIGNTITLKPMVDRKFTGANPGSKKFFDIVGDEIVVLGTRYAKGDYYDYLESNLEELKYVKYTRNLYKNGQNGDDGYLWSEKFNDDRVERLRSRLTPKRFASQYLNRIVAEEDVVLSRSWVKWMEVDWIEIKERNEVHIKMPARITGDVIDRTVVLSPVLFIDPAISQKKKADNTVIMVGGIDSERNLYVLDYSYGKYLPFKIVEEMYRLANKWHMYACHVEVVAFQQVLAYLIKQSFNKFRPIVVKEYRPKGEKKGRIKTMLEPYFKNCKVWMMKYMATNAKLTEEIEYFPQEGVSDDFLDVMAMIVEVCQPTAEKPKVRRPLPRYGANMKYGGIR